MHRLSGALIAAVSAIAFTQIAFAADIPTKAPVYKAAPVVAPSWTGCYVGANVGYGWQKNQAFDAIALLDTGSDTGTGVIGGGQVGCDYQFASRWVIGIQGMVDGVNIKGNHSYPGNPLEILNFSTKWVATLTGRIGYVVVPQALLYVKGGAAWMQIDYSDTYPGGGVKYSGAADVTRNGWTIGGGVEYAFLPNWAVFAEYNYTDVGSRNVALTYTCSSGVCPFLNPYTYTEKHNLQTVLVGLNYRFGR